MGGRTETLGYPSIGIAGGTGMVAGGTGLIAQPGTIDINVPLGVSINQVLLYREGTSNSLNNMNCNGVVHVDQITIENMDVTGQMIGGHTFVPINPLPRGCVSSYRADITELGLVQPGANSLEVEGLNFTRENHGASILVIFDEGGERARHQPV